jgi:hypothetical protein
LIEDLDLLKELNGCQGPNHSFPDLSQLIGEEGISPVKKHTESTCT